MTSNKLQKMALMFCVLAQAFLAIIPGVFFFQLATTNGAGQMWGGLIGVVALAFFPITALLMGTRFVFDIHSQQDLNNLRKAYVLYLVSVFLVTIAGFANNLLYSGTNLIAKGVVALGFPLLLMSLLFASTWNKEN